jgi:phosphoribosyl-dephospho-CoA transferase
MKFKPHDLLRLDGTRDAVLLEEHSEVALALLAVPFVVVRRAPERVGWVAVGIRGWERTERFGAWIKMSGVVERWTPEQVRVLPRKRSLPAFHTLTMLEERWRTRAMAWGPSGSVGFELVSDAEVVTPQSDLDVVLRFERPLEREVARELLDETRELPARVDAQMQTPEGSVSLEEYALGERPILMRKMHGVLLCDDPWAAQAVAELA